MTDSTKNKGGCKRDRLVASAADLLHQQGASATTLAGVAHAAGVPPGNMYYYFKTKDDLVRAVIDTRATQIQAMFAVLDALPGPADRLKAMVQSWTDIQDLIAHHGCPIGSLAAELATRTDGLADHAADLIERFIGWEQRQFQQMGREGDRDLAITLLARIQGAALLTSSLHDPQIMTGQAQHIKDWIDSLT